MKNIVFCSFILPLIFFGQYSAAQELEKQISGAVIVVALTGDAVLSDQEGKILKKRMSVGSIIPVGRFAETKKGSSLSLLLSNGTVITVQENSKMKIGTFVQEPFDSAGKKVSDLTEEPSTSNVSIDLDLGSLVVKTKKLNKRSTLNIHSPVGVAGIRGTEFQMGLQSDGALQLDVTESTVSFTPPGGQPTMVAQGQGLDVTSTGALNIRPVNPETAQNITTTNETATQASEDLSLDTVADAMVETETATESENTSTENPADESGNSDSQNNEPPPAPENPDTNTPSVNMDEIMEQNPDAKQMRKTGEEALPLEELNQFNFNAEDLDKFLSLPLEVQQEFLLMEVDLVVRLIGLRDFGRDAAITLMGYNSEVRNLILGLEDMPMLSLLEARLDENIIKATFTDENLQLARTSNLPEELIANPLEEEILYLADEMKDKGNDNLVEEIFSNPDKEWTEEDLDNARIANILIRDLDLTPETLDNELVTQENAIGNPFYLEVSSLYETLLDDQLVFGEDDLFLGARNINMIAGDYHLPSSISAEGFVVGSTESISLSGSYSFSADSTKNVRLVVMSGDGLTMDDGSSMYASLSEMVVAARSDILLRDIRLDSGRDVALRSLRDIHLTNTSIYSSDRVKIMANRDLYVDGLKLSQNLPSLIMEATTIRLRNIDFPSVTQVQLNSLKGPIDGRYPNFGTSIPQTQQLGRVNFLENIRSGGNLLMDRASFDQFGGNIKIGKLP